MGSLDTKDLWLALRQSCLTADHRLDMCHLRLHWALGPPGSAEAEAAPVGELLDLALLLPRHVRIVEGRVVVCIVANRFVLVPWIRMLLEQFLRLRIRVVCICIPYQ